LRHCASAKNGLDYGFYFQLRCFLETIADNAGAARVGYCLF